VPTNTLRGNDPQTPILSAVRESQTAFIDVIRSWTDITEQFTRRLSLPVAGIDVAGALDRAFDLAAQTLAAQRQLAHTLVGAVDRQVEVVVETVETTGIEAAHRIEGELQRGRERVAQLQASTGDAPTAELPTQDGKPDRRTYEERSIEELRERARELEIEGRSAMSKDDLVAALRRHAK
jgi:hypothetical protein